mmetsp:Transcript_68501/g.198723  ORF Transcript_68501/g.198723 Transcript_68501/m.198723 type:complete len:203 (-) Transcript_68501:160-768(-)
MPTWRLARPRPGTELADSWTATTAGRARATRTPRLRPSASSRRHGPSWSRRAQLRAKQRRLWAREPRPRAPVSAAASARSASQLRQSRRRPRWLPASRPWVPGCSRALAAPLQCPPEPPGPAPPRPLAHRQPLLELRRKRSCPLRRRPLRPWLRRGRRRRMPQPAPASAGTMFLQGSRGCLPGRASRCSRPCRRGRASRFCT